MPQDMRDAKIITLYKKKGARSDCNNRSRISLLGISGKGFASVHKLAERVYSESQYGFRSQRSTTEMVFSARQLQEKCKEQNVPLYITFIAIVISLKLSI